jgi:hypothetical protein
MAPTRGTHHGVVAFAAGTLNRSGGISNQNLYFFQLGCQHHRLLYSVQWHSTLLVEQQELEPMCNHRRLALDVGWPGHVQLVSAIRLYEDGNCNDLELEVCDCITIPVTQTEMVDVQDDRA